MELRNVRIVTPGGVIENGSLSVAEGRIVEITKASGTPSGLTVLPGFIDLHIHGGGGADTMNATPEALATICRTHAAHGTTRLLATTITQSREAITVALANAAASTEPLLGGIHLEGPYISPGKPGAQPKEFVRNYDAEEFVGWLTAAQGKLRQITLAPEQPGGDALMAACNAAGIVISLGHTDVGTEVGFVDALNPQFRRRDYALRKRPIERRHTERDEDVVKPLPENPVLEPGVHSWEGAWHTLS